MPEPLAGCHGRLAVVDLTSRQVSELPYGRGEAVDHFGGSLLGLRLLMERTPAGLDPYDPRALLVLTAGVLGGTRAPGLARCVLVGKSPLTGAAAESHLLGPFAAALKGTGLDGVVVTGCADTPVHLLVAEGTVAVHDATDLRGLGTARATDRLQERHGSSAQVAAIGPAGENLVRYASVVADRGYPAARYGLGAVFGAKNLKAVVCVGTRSPEVADASALAALTTAYRADIPGNPLAAWQHADPGFAAWAGEALDPGYAAVRNFSDTGRLGLRLPQAEDYPGRAVRTSGACPGCPNDCLKTYAPLEDSTDHRSGGLLQETYLALGWNLGIDHLDTVLAANARCNDLGLDPVSLGGTLAWAMECGEHGLLDGPRFDAPGELISLVERVARRADPLATLLAEGSARAAQRLDLGAHRLAMTVKGAETPPFDPRIQPGIGLGYAVSPGGPRYDAVEHDLDFDPDHGSPSYLSETARIGVPSPAPAVALDAERGRRTARLMRLWSGLDALSVCLYASSPTRPLTIDRITDLVTAVSGLPFELGDLLDLGQRRLDVMRAYALREGLDPGGDALPDRFHDEPVNAGPFAGARLDRAAFDEAITALFAELGWSPGSVIRT
jgi:aldehyde:ferredoxin oxidoreductase